MNLKDYIRSIPDYPKKGILFRDITTLIKDSDAFKECIDQIIERSKNHKIDKNDSVLIIDDLIATGGTAEAAAKLVEMSDANVEN